MDRKEYKRQYMQQYNKSERGRAAQDRYNNSDKGRQTRSRYGNWYRNREEDTVNYIPVILVVLLVAVVAAFLMGCGHKREVYRSTYMKGYAIDLSKPVTVTTSHDD